jgi:glutathione S-transferase
MMKLYITTGSPYARMARIMVLEKTLEDRVEIVPAQTRSIDSPYFKINPSGRVPYLIRDDGVGLEESAVVCRYLDHLDGNPQFELPEGEHGWEALRLGALASSLMDGLSVWLREVGRPRNEQSPPVIGHEMDRAARLIDRWETEIDHPWMLGKLNLVQIALVCALGIEARNPDFRWREGHPTLCAWLDHMAARPSIWKTLPPTAH